MSAATASFDAPEAPEPDLYTNIPVAAGAVLFVGTILAFDTSGNANPAADAAGLYVAGRCEGLTQTPDPTAAGINETGARSGNGDLIQGGDANNFNGAAGALQVNIKRGVFRWNNASGGNALTAAMIGQPAYVYDDITVGIAAGTTHAVVAGIVYFVDDDGVYVDTRRRTPVINLYAPTEDTITDSTGGTAATPSAGTIIVGTIHPATTDTSAAKLTDTQNAFSTLIAEIAKLKADQAAILARLG